MVTSVRHSRRNAARPLRGTLGATGGDFVRGVLPAVPYAIPARLLDRVCLLSVGLCPALYTEQLHQAASMRQNCLHWWRYGRWPDD